MNAKTRVAIQGIKASFHEEAAYKFFGNHIETVECNSFKQTCDVLDGGDADYVIMAIENSIAGSLLPNYTLIRDYGFSVVGEVYIPIRLHLMALPGVKFEDLKTVTSHPIAIRQCVDFFYDFPQINIVEGNDTAACAKKIQDEQLRDTAAVANTLAAELYGLNILERSVESNKKNFTRFLILKKEKTDEGKNINKASICFQVGHKAGSLAQVLNIFAAHDVILTKIQSMPVLGKRDEYYFYVDLEWPATEKYDKALRKVLKYTTNFNILGEYEKNDKV